MMKMTCLNAMSVILFSLSLPIHAGEIRVNVKDQHGKAVEDAVLLLTPVDPSKIPKLKPKDEVVDQIDKEFVPYVKPIVTGSRVFFPNKDNVRHHVYSFSQAKSFEIQLYSGKSAAPVVLDKAGIVVLGCNIHDWMLGYIYVADTPYFGKSKSDGNITVAALPDGEYTLKIWHPGMGMTAGENGKRVTISESNVAQLNWQVNLKPIIRIPRKTSGQGPGY
ncbi:methylamine utilization protein [Undibacterium fentianense]|uniref:Methylamine utilization protein n=1 Tax=Undibacterium fentianense TaxID=2828728 RepID=A0A941DZK1_9BURK|nr:methylamine utilization protein [Undibacterium fentianense]MBR7799705.1 methylamine utilization protein [Undibacterium fentianense]